MGSTVPISRVLANLTSAVLMLAAIGCTNDSDDEISFDDDSSSALASCNSDGVASRQTLEETISNCRKLWRQSKLSSYMYTYTTALPDCFPWVVEKVITLENSNVSSVFLPATGTFADEDTTIVEPSKVFVGTSPSTGNIDAPTIDEIFSLLERLAASEDFFVENLEDTSLLPQFNSQYGYPVAYSIRQKRTGLCFAYTATVTEFQ